MATLSEALNEAIDRLAALLDQHIEHQRVLAEVQHRLYLLSVRLNGVYGG